MKSSLDERAFAVKVVKTLRDAGHEALFAGGCVRDEILGLVPADFDVASSATPDQVQGLFRKSLAVGAAFGVVEVLGPRVANQTIHVQVATFRTDGPYVDGRRPTSVHFGSSRDDALRRDFTINGMFLDPITGEVLDYVGGRKDLEARLVRAIGKPVDRFGEDKLRVLRAVRMAARFGFTIEEETWKAVLGNASLIQLVSPERISDELRRIFAHPTRWEGVRLLIQSRLFQEIFGKDYLPGELALKALSHLPLHAPFPLVLSLFAPDRSTIEFWGEKLRLARNEIGLAQWLMDHAGTFARADHLPNSILYPLFDHPDHLWLLARDTAFVHARGESSTGIGRCQELLDRPPPAGFAPTPLANGNDLKSWGISPGPAFSTLLSQIRASQLDHRIQTPEQARELAVKLYEQMDKGKHKETP